MSLYRQQQGQSASLPQRAPPVTLRPHPPLPAGGSAWARAPARAGAAPGRGDAACLLRPLSAAAAARAPPPPPPRPSPSRRHLRAPGPPPAAARRAARRPCRPRPGPRS
ncbi:unnamed protein product [Nyctereutes procyonoides]|uniref:(raccoon dog) hypothetical protein n=1 Tax=Nyctereutes procyonoides TaxID=34880 RepID=A0A811YET0_NYCPR|nr:unnamed protein product [Nyctereutes procyonoides]